MVLFFYIVLNVLALFLFIKKKKMLHVLEIIVYWMISTYLYQNFSAICYMNFKTLIVPEKLSLEFSHFINRTVLFPLLMVIFLHYFLILTTYCKKMLLIASFVFLLTGLEYLSDLLGVLIHKNWRVCVVVCILGGNTIDVTCLYEGLS
ncbi:hypothetical protein QE429_004634 [Bacillus sp. SORGH_AS 510]|uniref:hypothetical protein n=1 Tax=Bacillus sp. SORGH_AS_0510 TaxID=3041771 RepID=UPI002782F8C9|nr:hypothetical protein [Bacillus sp. SORGH_AS_0510]MDQ1147807.1 hypothetical protein [Bacillus sp. SORGH_AS_0510]